MVSYPSGGVPFLYAADAAWTHDTLAQGRLAPAARLVRDDRADMQDSLDRLRRFRGDIAFCHDPAPHPFDIEVAR